MQEKNASDLKSTCVFSSTSYSLVPLVVGENLANHRNVSIEGAYGIQTWSFSQAFAFLGLLETTNRPAKPLNPKKHQPRDREQHESASGDETSFSPPPVLGDLELGALPLPSGELLPGKVSVSDVRWRARGEGGSSFRARDPPGRHRPLWSSLRSFCLAHLGTIGEKPRTNTNSSETACGDGRLSMTRS